MTEIDSKILNIFGERFNNLKFSTHLIHSDGGNRILKNTNDLNFEILFSEGKEVILSTKFSLSEEFSKNGDFKEYYTLPKSSRNFEYVRYAKKWVAHPTIADFVCFMIQVRDWMEDVEKSGEVGGEIYEDCKDKYSEVTLTFPVEIGKAIQELWEFERKNQ